MRRTAGYLIVLVERLPRRCAPRNDMLSQLSYTKQSHCCPN